MNRQKDMVVRALSQRSQKGWLTLGGVRVACALGRSGRTVAKREGDGATPVGRFALRRLYYRADRVGRPRVVFPASPIGPSDGWCDAPSHRLYNRFVRHPFPASAEHMWRADRLYDVVIVLGHNDRPRVRGKGSAIFMHIARDGLRTTEGCVALAPGDMRRLLPRLSRRTGIRII